MTTSFSNLTVDDLPDIQMIAGDHQDFTYKVYDSASALVDLNGATATVVIFRYRDPSYVFATLVGTISASPLGTITAELTSASSITMTGVYTHQPIIVDYIGKKHIPSQGKIFVSPSPNS